MSPRRLRSANVLGYDGCSTSTKILLNLMVFSTVGAAAPFSFAFVTHGSGVLLPLKLPSRNCPVANTRGAPWPRLTLTSAASSATTRTSATTKSDDDDNIQVGDTRGADLLVDNLTVMRGSALILDSVELRVERGERWGIVGPNGCGKSTLLGSIVGTVLRESGRAIVAPKVKVGYLKQTAVAGSTATVLEEAMSGMVEYREAKERYEQMQQEVSIGNTTPEALRKLDNAVQRLSEVTGGAAGANMNESDDGFMERVSAEVLGGLGFQREDYNKLCSEFSGGWQMRIGLAKLLLSKPTLLLLDEPSNHLDSAARDWLAQYLKEYDGTVILVSHDVPLLTTSVNSFAEFRAGSLISYRKIGSYDQFLEERQRRLKAAQAEFERNTAEAEKLQAYVDRFGASANRAASAKSRAKKLEKMERSGLLDVPTDVATARKFRPTIRLPDPPKVTGHELIVLEDAAIGWAEDGAPLISDVNLSVDRGMKLVLRGPNGAGKSTLLAALRGTLEILSGRRLENESLRLGVFTQDLAQELDVTARAVDLVTSYAREGLGGNIAVSDQEARTVMGQLGLSSDKPLRKVGDLSGGEKARVALAMFAIKASNVLLLDEPSNHLDVECIEALGESLGRWGKDDGALVVVSHDRSFCESVGFTHVGTVRDGIFTLEERDLQDSDWDQYDMKGSTAGSKEEAETGGAMGGKEAVLTLEEKEEQRQLKKKAYNAPKRIAKLEKLIESAERKIAELDNEMMNNGSDASKLMELNSAKEEEEAKVMEYMEEWEVLEGLLAKVGSNV